MRGPMALLSSRRRSDRLRAVGLLVLVCGGLGAALFYWTETRAALRTLDDLMPGYDAARRRQVGILIGTLGVTLVDGLREIEEPGPAALLIAGTSALIGIVCFRIARLMDVPVPDPAAPTMASTGGHDPSGEPADRQNPMLQ